MYSFMHEMEKYPPGSPIFILGHLKQAYFYEQRYIWANQSSGRKIRKHIQ